MVENKAPAHDAPMTAGWAGHFSLTGNARKLLGPGKPGHMTVLDGFRSMAILWVIGFHLLWHIGRFDLEAFLGLHRETAVSWLNWGFQGVDIFFVVSGFIIAHTLILEWRRNGFIHIRRFYLRRVLRLLPAYYAALLLYALIDRSALPSIWSNLIYINNMLPVERQYMPWSWSLAIEEQFYVFFPLLLTGLLALRRGMFLWLGALLAAAFAVRFNIAVAYRVPAPPAHPALDFERFAFVYETLYLGLHVRFGALLLGVLAAMILHFSAGLAFLDKNSAMRRGLLCLALLCLLLPAFVGAESEVADRPVMLALGLAFYPYLFAASIAYLLLYSLTDAGQRSRGGRFLKLRCWYPVAQLSYSLYLMHPMVILSVYPYARRAFEDGLAGTLSLWIVLLPIVFLAAFLLYLLVERPVMNFKETVPAGAPARRAGLE